MKAILLHNRAMSAKKCAKKRAKLLFCQPKGLFTWRWGTPVRWGNLLRWGNPPVLIISHFNLIMFTSPIWGPPPSCKKALNLLLFGRFRCRCLSSLVACWGSRQEEKWASRHFPGCTSKQRSKFSRGEEVYGLYKLVPSWRVWFSRSLVWNRV